MSSVGWQQHHLHFAISREQLIWVAEEEGIAHANQAVCNAAAFETGVRLGRRQQYSRAVGATRFPLGQTIELIVAKNDNSAVGTLFRIGGEGRAMAARFRLWNIHGECVDRSERRCDLDRNGVLRYRPRINGRMG